MPISGLVVTVDETDPCVVGALANLPGVQLGEATGARVPCVAETTDVHSEASLYRRIEALSGVVQVEVAFHDFSDVTTVDRLPSRGGKERRR